MFDLLYNFGIGQNVADFYKAYASLVVDVGDLDKAGGIYKKALDLGIESLRTTYEFAAFVLGDHYFLNLFDNI